MHRPPRCGPSAPLPISSLTSVPTLAPAALDIKHLFDAPGKVSYPCDRRVSYERSIERLFVYLAGGQGCIEQPCDRTLIRRGEAQDERDNRRRAGPARRRGAQKLGRDG